MIPAATSVTWPTAHCEVNALRAWLRTLFGGAGLSADDADAVAGNLAEAEARGVRSHGLILVPVYLERIRSGGIRTSYSMRVIRAGGPTLLLDGDYGPGQSLAYRATDMAAERARRFGLCLTVLGNSNHVGMLASYGLRAVKAGMIGLIQTNSGPSVTPARGRKRLIGNNAICLAVPTDSAPFIFDTATGVVACGKVRILSLQEDQLPEGWILNAAGEPSRNPEDLDRGGCVLPAGQHKGYGLAVLVDILTALLAGGPPSFAVANQRRTPHTATGASQSFLLIDPERFAGLSALQTAVEQYRQVLRQAPPRDPNLPVLAPGDPELEAEDHCRREGIPIPESLLEQLDRLAAGLGLPGISENCSSNRRD